MSTNASDANAKVSRTCSLGVHTRTHARVCVCVCVCVRACARAEGARVSQARVVGVQWDLMEE